MSYSTSRGINRMPKIPDKSHLKSLFSLHQNVKTNSKNNNSIR